MVQTCCVIGCHNKFNKEENRGFFRFPNILTHQGPQTEELSRKRQAKWLSNISRADLTHPTISTRVCSDHFISGPSECTVMEHGVHYRVMVGEDSNDVISFMDKNFFTEEIIAKSLGFQIPRETRAYYNSVMPICTDSELSVVAVDSSRSEIVGVILNVVSTLEISNEFSFDPEDEDTKKLARMDKVYDPVYEGIDFFHMYATSILVANRGICVSKAHRRKGIAIGLIRSTLERVQQRGIPCYVVEATSAYTRAIMERLNFDKVAEKPYKELLVGGEQIVTDNSVHESLSLHAIRLTCA